MVPNASKPGHSFKGAMAYFLHDKREGEDSRAPDTAERVAWTETRNLATDDTATATRIMVATAQQADQLKASAGVKATGRKSKAHVYTYSLAWHAEEAPTLTREHMLSCVDETLKLLGAENHQALIVCHRDTEHPHVHVVLNRVDTRTGIMLPLNHDRDKLNDWALAYRRARGEEHKYCPKREEKRQRREQHPDRDERRRHSEKQLHNAKQEQRRHDGKDPNPAATLKAFSEEQKARHSQQWRDLSERNKTERTAIYDGSGALIRQAIAHNKDKHRRTWAKHFQQARTEEKAFHDREKRLGGILRNAIDAARSTRVSEQLGNRGNLSALFQHVVSKQARLDAFKAVQDNYREQLSHVVKADLDREIRAIKEARAAELQKQRERFQQERTALIERQNAEREKVRAAWRQIRAERDQPKERPRPQPITGDMRQTRTQPDEITADSYQPRFLPRTDTERTAPAKPSPKPKPAPAALKSPAKGIAPSRPTPTAPARATPTARPGGASSDRVTQEQRAAAAPTPQEQAKKEAERLSWWEQSRSDSPASTAQPWSSAARSSDRRPWESGIGREDEGRDTERGRERTPDRKEPKQ